MPEYDRACAGGGYRQNLDNLTTRLLNPSLQGPADSIPSHDLGQGSDDAFPQYPPRGHHYIIHPLRSNTRFSYHNFFNFGLISKYTHSTAKRSC